MSEPCLDVTCALLTITSPIEDLTGPLPTLKRSWLLILTMISKAKLFEGRPNCL